MAESLDDFLARIERQESGGNATAKNARTGAYGRFQIMPANWAPWAREAGLGADAPKTAGNQEIVARFKMQQYYQQFGSWDAVAVAWYAGPGAAAAWVKNPDMPRFNRKQGKGNEPSINEYVASIRGRKGGTSGRFGGPSKDALQDILADATEKPMSDADVLAAIRRDYGYLVAYVKDPELGPILIQAAKEGWDDARLTGKVSATKWWKTHSAKQRVWDAKWRTDIASARQEVAAAQQDIGQQAERMGVTLDPKRSRDLAIAVLREGWTAEQVQDALAAEFEYKPGKSTGAGGVTADALKQMAAEYVVPLSDKAVQQWTRQILDGSDSAENFKKYLTEQAKSLYPVMSTSLDQGRSVRQYADPYVQIAAKRLGVNPDDVDLTETKWMRPLMQINDKNERVAMSLDQWDRELKSNPEYGYSRTPEAHEAAASWVEALGQTFGKVAR